MVQKMITEFLTSTLFLLKRLAPIYILSKIYVSNIMFLFQKMLTTEILNMCVTYKRNATFNEKLNELRTCICNTCTCTNWYMYAYVMCVCNVMYDVHHVCMYIYIIYIHVHYIHTTRAYMYIHVCSTLHT